MHMTRHMSTTMEAPVVSMPSTSGDASDEASGKQDHSREVSMPSTSGDASDTLTVGVNPDDTFQCPQHRAMHLTVSERIDALPVNGFNALNIGRCI